MVEGKILPQLSRRGFLQLSAALAPAPWPQGATTKDATPGPFKCLWLAEDSDADTYAAFRGGFEISAADEIEVRFLGASWFVIWLDGSYFSEGPARFIAEYPEYQSCRVQLSPGKHVLAAQVHYEGLATRLLRDVHPFWMCQVVLRGEEIPVQWKAVKLGGFESKVRRINPELGWIEWADTRKQPPSWQNPSFDDTTWILPVESKVRLGAFQPLGHCGQRAIPHELPAQSEGTLVEQFGYEIDDPAARLFLRCLEDCGLPPQGVWRRYDLGRVRLGRPRLVPWWSSHTVSRWSEGG